MALNGIAEYHSTTHIIYHEEGNNENNRSARLVDLRTGHHHQALGPNVTVCSSSQGILLLHYVAEGGLIDSYFLCNPLVNNFVKPLHFRPQPHHPHDARYVIIAVEGPTFDVVFLKRLPYNDGERYEAVVFSSDIDSSFTMDIGVLMRDREVVPDSGVSCGRNAYFLIDTNSILKIDVVSREYSRIFMPINDISTCDRITAQLGSAMGMLGLAIANKSKLWVKVYLRFQINDVRNWTNLCTVTVKLEQDCDDVSIVQDEKGGLMKIRCKEMPRPVRFESLRLQVPLWVDGRIVMVEMVNNGSILLRRIDCQIPPSCVTCGMSYVESLSRLLYRIGS